MPAGRPNYLLRRGVALALLLGLLFISVQAVSWLTSLGDDPASATGTTTTQAPDSTTASVAAVAIEAPPACAFAETLTESPLAEDWQRSIVDTDRRLPADYVPTGLGSASAAGFQEEYEVRDVMVDDLAALRQAADQNGTPIELIAAYRSVADQQDLFSRREAELGFEAAAARTARPGHSEHHLGTAVDFKTAGEPDVFQSWADEPTGQFVLANAHRFGFVNSFPRGLEAKTCYDFEPWHFRYFGVDLATRIHDSGLSAREYMWHWQATGAEPTT
ncbi:MAG TPA: M15 family metallopeptidase [Acidimicrobiales bacterium]|nr:M15 family metallopeptidase [Acidimicrobiales bacterium]